MSTSTSISISISPLKEPFKYSLAGPRGPHKVGHPDPEFEPGGRLGSLGSWPKTSGRFRRLLIALVKSMALMGSQA